MVYVGDTGKILSVWISCCSKHSVTALLCIKLINGNSCSNNLPVKTESVQESWQPLHNQQDSNSQHCKQLNSVNKTLCYIILFTMICYVLFNTRLSLFNKISDQSFTHNNAQRQDIAPRSDIQYKHRRYYNKQKLQPGKCLTGQNKIKTKTKTIFDSLINLEGKWAEGSQWRRYIIILKDIICHGLSMMIGLVYSLVTIVTP